MRGAVAFLFIFSTLPLGHIIMSVINRPLASGHPDGAGIQFYSAAGMAVLGAGLLVVTRFLKSQAWQTVWGVIAGLFLWTSLAEYPFIFGAHNLGIKPGNLMAVKATSPEYMMLEYTWGMVVIIMLYLLFHEGVRCPMFVWLRRKLNLAAGKAVSGEVFNYGPRTAFEYVIITWAFYDLLLIAYDERIFGSRSAFTHVIFILCLAFSIYLFYRLVRIRETGYAVRYAIPAAMVIWSAFGEIMNKWGFYRDPWGEIFNVPAMASLTASFLTAFILIYRETKTPLQSNNETPKNTELTDRNLRCKI